MYENTCVICNENFHSKRRDKKVCSIKCFNARAVISATISNKKKIYSLEYRRKFYKPYSEKDRERKRLWLKSPGGILWSKNHNEKRRSGAIGKLKYGEWKEIKIKYGFMCLACMKKEPEIKLTIDHIVPISKGGRHEKENLQPLCGKCNSEKFTQIIDYRKKIILA